jgi:glycosyltransferase involved in cell wall biosynthesis
MKIVHTLLRYPPATGGVEEYTRELVERLRADEEDVRVETTSLKTHHPPTTLADPLHDPPYVHRHEAHTFDAVGYPIPYGLKEELLGLPMDILHAHAFWYAPADIAARVAKRRNIPFVFNPYYYNTGNRRTMKWQLYRILYGRSTIAAADAIVVISPQEKDLLTRDGFLFQRTELIPPGIDPQEFTESSASPFLRWGVDSDRVMLFVGRIARSKGLDLLVHALATVKRTVHDAQLAVIGEDFGFRRECELLALKLGVADDITWVGKVSREDLLAAYRHARVLVLPSRYEAFGIVLLEAAASGCPVVATNGSAIPFVVKDGETGLLFAPEESADLAEKIVTILEDSSFAKRLGAQAKERARRDWTWEKSVRALRALYADVLAEKKKEQAAHPAS